MQQPSYTIRIKPDYQELAIDGCLYRIEDIAELLPDASKFPEFQTRLNDMLKGLKPLSREILEQKAFYKYSYKSSEKKSGSTIKYTSILGWLREVIPLKAHYIELLKPVAEELPDVLTAEERTLLAESIGTKPLKEELASIDKEVQEKENSNINDLINNITANFDPAAEELALIAEMEPDHQRMKEAIRERAEYEIFKLYMQENGEIISQIEQEIDFVLSEEREKPVQQQKQKQSFSDMFSDIVYGDGNDNAEMYAITNAIRATRGKFNPYR